MLGGFTEADGTLEFYGRVNAAIDGSMTVLDLGAGRAEWFEDDPCDWRRRMRLLRGKAAKVIAADPDPAVLGNRASDEQLLIEDGRLPLPDASVDLAVADYVLEHVDDPDAFAAEVARVLKPGGLFCARTPHAWSYVSLASRLVPDALHAKVLSRVQVARKEEDVFPTVYRMNTRRAIARRFAGWGDYSYVYVPSPAYYFGRRWLFRAFDALHRALPTPAAGYVFAFLRKPA
jgi:SAM-dependent methyltransferase